MTEIRGRTFLAAITACLILLFCAESVPASSKEAGRKYAVALERLSDLKRSPQRKKYRSYWIDCVRLFELIETRHPSSPQAADACFDRANIYLDLYRYNRSRKDLDEASRSFAKCQAAHPGHKRAPEALYHRVVIAKSFRQDGAAAMDALRVLTVAYPDSAWTAKAKAHMGVNTAAQKNGKRKKEPEIRKPPEASIAAQPHPSPEPGIVKGIRYWSGSAYTRIVIDQDKPLRFQAFELKKPDRLVFDIRNARLDDTVTKDPIAVNDGILRQVRASQNDPDTVRVVLDLASLKSYAAFPLPDPERIVIDITGDAPEEGEAGTGRPEGAVAPPAPREPTTSPAGSAAPGSSEGKVSLTEQLGLKIKTIAIDAGHGGHDPGAIGKSGLKEKTVTLDIARRLAVLVRERLGIRVIMTRDSDVYIPLDERPAIARTKGADLFVSVHVNANRKRKARGIETYIQSLRASDRDAMATAALENATSTKTLSQLDTELARILKDLHTDAKQEDSLELAHAVQASLVSTVGPVQGHVVNLGVKRAFFYVLINTNMPSILAEVGFISNPSEEKLLGKDAYRQKIAEALFDGVKKYVESRGQQVAGL